MALPDFYLPIDYTGAKASNLISNERHILADAEYRIIFPKYGVYFSANVQVYAVNIETNERTLLTKNIHYHCIEMLPKMTFQLGKEIHAGILIIDPNVSSTIDITYQALGGSDNINHELFNQALESVLHPPGLTIDWKDLIKPKEFPVKDHWQDADDVYGLEYVVDALDRVRAAVLVTDDVFHKGLVNHIETRKGDFFYDFNVTINDQLDLIATQYYAANEANRLTHEILLEAETQNTQSERTLNIADLKDAQFALNNYNAKYAQTLMFLLKKQYEFNGSLFNLPPHLEGLQCWLDFSETNTVQLDAETIHIYDKSIYKRRWSGPMMAYGPSENFAHNTLKFYTGNVLAQTDGPPLNFTAPMTVFCITGQTEGEQILNLFTNDTYGLTTDIYNGNLLSLTKLDKTEADVNVRCSLSEVEKQLLVVMGLSDDLKDDISYTNVLETTYRHYNGFEFKPTLTGKTITLTQMGHPNLPQSGELLFYLAYNRQLSKYEIEAVLAYIKQKFNIGVNYIGNHRFNDGLAEFRTDYLISLNAANKGEIATVSKKILFQYRSDLITLYQYPGFMDYLVQLEENDKVLLVNTSVDANKAFWIEDLRLDQYVRYEFSLDILYDPTNKPNLHLLINGEDYLAPLSLPNNPTGKVTTKLTFVANSNTVNLALKNLNTAGEINTFVIDNISLVRKLY